MKHLSQSLEETKKIAEEFLAPITPGSEATIVALQGDLGAGKTAFAQTMGKIMGVDENMHSPTFVIMKIYDINFKGFQKLIHIDAYRIEKDKELLHLGWKQIIREPENLIVIEWPEKVAGIMTKDAKKIFFKFINENTREIDLHG